MEQEYVTVILNVEVARFPGPDVFLSQRGQEAWSLSSDPSVVNPHDPKIEIERIVGTPIHFPKVGLVNLGMSKKARMQIGDLVGALVAQENRNRVLEEQLEKTKGQLRIFQRERWLLMNLLPTLNGRTRHAITKALSLCRVVL